MSTCEFSMFRLAPFQTLYQGTETVKERGFCVGDAVHVGADYSEKFGTVVGLDPKIPFKACVELHHNNGASTTCWIKSEHLLIFSKKGDDRSRIDSQMMKLFGSLYQGRETVEERGFCVGDTVHVGADYSEKFGTVVGLDPEIPFKARVELHHNNGASTTCWIKSEYLLIHSKK